MEPKKQIDKTKVKKNTYTKEYQLDEEQIKELNKNCKKIKTNKNEDAYLIDNKYLFRKEREIKKSNSFLFRCIKYREQDQCQSFINVKNDIITNANPKHNHIVDNKKITRYIVREEIKTKIDKMENPYNIKLKIYMKI